MSREQLLKIRELVAVICREAENSADKLLQLMEGRMNCIDLLQVRFHVML